MNTLFYRNPRLTTLVVMLIVLAGAVSFILLPRMEDPELTPRAATLTTIFPGADAERVESLVTTKIEDALKEIEEIKEIRSVSRSNVSFIAIELRDDVTKSSAATIWARVRDKASDAAVEFPPDVVRPQFERLDVRAFALIVALRWDGEGSPNYAVLRRHLKELKDRIDAVSGTERSDIFGDPGEEIVVTIRPEAASSLHLTPALISQLIFASDSKTSAGQIHNKSEQLQLEVSGELDNLTRISQITVQSGDGNSFVELSDVATIEKAVADPPQSKVLLKDRPAVVLGVLVRSATRIDHWSAATKPILDECRRQLPPGVSLDFIFEQNPYVQTRMHSLWINLLQGGAAVFLTVFILHGFRISIIISLVLPLACLAILAAMYWMGIPMHQMSFTGLIISLGLLIDNSIIMVDEVFRRMRSNPSTLEAVGGSVKFMALPLFGATFTTVLSFGPIALMPGPAGEFVGSIGTVTIMAVVFSMILSLTIIAAVAGWFLASSSRQSNRTFWTEGFSNPWMTRVYSRLLEATFRHPLVGAAVCAALPVLGLLSFALLPDQFFPPADRHQFQIQLELPATSSMKDTEAVAAAIRSTLIAEPEITNVSWFLGDSAPSFYYNVIPDRKAVPNYGQAIVDIKPGTDVRTLIRRLQVSLEQQHPQASCLVRQLEQGPPFTAPIEVRIFGPDLEILTELGEQVRLIMTQTPQVILARSDLSEALPKIVFDIDEQQSIMAGLDRRTIADALNSSLEGTIGGSVLESTEELPVRVRVSGERRGDVNRIASLDLLTSGLVSATNLSEGYPGVPLNAISQLKLAAEFAGVPHYNGQRVNEVQGFILAGSLPTEVQQDFKQRLAASGLTLPSGYSLTFAGATAKRDEAIENLVANTFILGATFITTLVLSFGSYRMASIIMAVAGLSVGFGIGSLWLANLPWGFMGVVGTLGMVGAAVNDSIVVLSVLMELPPEKARDIAAIRDAILANTRHILSTTLTTIFGFTPLMLGGGEFWPPVAVTISGGVGGCTYLALFFVPCMYLLMPRRVAVAQTTSATPALAHPIFTPQPATV